MQRMTDSKQYYVRRTIIAGASVFVISILAGIAFRGWHEWRTPLLEPFTVSELLFVSTVGPLAASVMATPLTVFVLITVAIMVSFGSRSKRIWLSLSAFVLLGLYWLFMVEVIREFALMD
jgi:uncharacterized membrane protein